MILGSLVFAIATGLFISSVEGISMRWSGISPAISVLVLPAA